MQDKYFSAGSKYSAAGNKKFHSRVKSFFSSGKAKSSAIEFAMITITSFMLFLPIDMILFEADGSYSLDSEQLISNIAVYSVVTVMNMVIVSRLNKDFWRNKAAIKFVVEIVSTLLAFNLFHYLLYNVLWETMSVHEFIYNGTVKSKIILENSTQAVLNLIITEMFYQYRMRRQEELEKEKFHYIQLKNQLNPHFLFNSLNVLAGMAYCKTPEEISKYAVRLSNTCRYILDKMDEDIMTIEDELAFINNYINVLNERMENTIILKINIDERLMKCKIPLLSFQLLAENAVKHNVFTKDYPLRINIENLEDQFLEISNNRQPKNISTDITTGIGLKNLEERYKALGCKGFTIVKTDKMFNVYIPIIKK